ncbi:MAG: WbqC family protein [Sphingobacteriales bacterium JAD_PAG50586_3]|nr:MAG: WbqC family protein [Sphingobacteriales bacterium JAD_PAG50586_3]
MVIAVMQPYVFPYLGYYQLVNAVDTFVFFDDVNYIMKGWINRNRVLQKNQPITFTIPLSKASQNRLINEIELSEFNRWRDAFLKQIAQYYGKAPYFTEVNAWLVDFFTKNEFTHISQLAAESVISVSQLLNLTTSFLYSSKLDYRVEGQNGQDKILSICEMQNAKMYINLQNGRELYEQIKFKKKILTCGLYILTI